ncbi:MAG: High-affinity branched-chain amino acid transport system permease protein LivH [Candidatus Heimdallarchaeota archaeon LC_2]|nr:MAG: High-affinity branched-chain amino acid transport system permease protein LivH [Candidatus Heimdallarchaeota archaeon LC_2]
MANFFQLDLKNNENAGSIIFLLILAPSFIVYLVLINLEGGSVDTESVSGILIRGFARGAFYALISVGFSIIFGVAKMFKLSIGGYFVIGAYTAFWFKESSKMGIDDIHKGGISNQTDLIFKLIIYAPIILFFGFLIYMFVYFGQTIGTGLILLNFAFLILERQLLIDNYDATGFTSTSLAFYIQAGFLLAGMSLIYLELTNKQILTFMFSLNILAVFFSLDSNFLISPALYLAIFFFSIIIVAIISMLVDRYLLEKARDNPTNVLIITFGIALLIQSIIPIFKFPSRGGFEVFGIDPHSLGGIVTTGERYQLFGTKIQALQVISAIFSLIFLILVYYFIKKTPMGRAMEAVSEDPEAAWLVGINVRKVYLVATGLGMALAAAAAILTTPFDARPNWSVFMGWTPLVFAIAVVTLGGIGSIFGSAIAGFIIGYTEVTVATNEVSLSGIVPLIMIFIIMLIRPNGLFGISEEGE